MKTTDFNEITLPQIDVLKSCPEHKEIFLRFMGHMRRVPISRMEIKILSSIQFTADMMDCSDAHIAKTLVDMGLRAPRLAFPNAFLDYFDRSMMRRGWDVGAPSAAMAELQAQWFAFLPQERLPLGSFRHVHSVVTEDVLI